MHMLKKLSSREKKYGAFPPKNKLFLLAHSIFMSINNSALVISQSCGAGHPTLDK